MQAAELPPHPWAAALHRCARPLIALATQLRTAVPARPGETAAALGEAVQRFERDLGETGCDARTVTAGSYLLCVWLDEVIAPHAWAAPTWPASSLLLQFHGEPDGRARVFQLLDRLMLQPVADRPLLELFHVCLSLGLQGRWQDAGDGARQLASLRSRLAQLLALNATPLEAPLSMRWQPALTARKPGQGRRLAAAGLMLVALAGLGVYSGSQWLLAAQVDQVFASLQGLEQASGSAHPVVAAAFGVAPPVASASGASATAPAGRMASALAAELQAGQVSVRDEPHRSLIVVPAEALFPPDTTQVAATGLPLLERVAQALAGSGGRVLVTAYAQADAARPARVPSASQLADEWARHVAQVLQRRVAAGNVASEGRVAPPVEPAAPAGATGRRSLIEITLYP